MMKHDHSAQKVGAVFGGEILRYESKTGDRFQVIGLFEAVNKRSALHRYLSEIVGDTRIGREQLRAKVEVGRDSVASFPLPPNSQILAGLRSFDELAVDQDRCRRRPTGDA